MTCFVWSESVVDCENLVDRDGQTGADPGLLKLVGRDDQTDADLESRKRVDPDVQIDAVQWNGNGGEIGDPESAGCPVENEAPV